MRTLSLPMHLPALMRSGRARPDLLHRLSAMRPVMALRPAAATRLVAVMRRPRALASAVRGRRAPALAATSAATGALVMYYMDPHAGRRRRALVRDRAAHLVRVFGRDVPRGIERRGRLLRGRARGLSHEAAELAHLGGHGGFADDETLVARVRSEALRDARVRPGEINIDAYEGCVTLRGQVESEGVIQDLVRAVRHIDGAAAVRSYLHLPGTLPPNKAESIEHVPAHLHTV